MQGDSALGRALALVRDLRTRCPWDRAQTPQTLRPYLVEEVLELFPLYVYSLLFQKFEQTVMPQPWMTLVKASDPVGDLVVDCSEWPAGRAHRRTISLP